MRSKEDAQDYRYFPDPDLPPLVIAPQWVEQVRSAMPELPGAMAERFMRDDGLPPYDAEMMTQSLALARYYEAARDACKQPKLVANWLMGEVSKRLNAKGLTIEQAPVAPATLAALIRRVVDGTVSNNGARQAFDHLWAAGRIQERPLSKDSADVSIADSVVVDETIEQLGLKQMSDSGALEAFVDQVLAANPKSIDEYKAGKDKALNALVGQVMKACQGKANPTQINELLRKKVPR